MANLYPQFKKEQREHPKLPRNVVWRIVFDHERMRKKRRR